MVSSLDLRSFRSLHFFEGMPPFQDTTIVFLLCSKRLASLLSFSSPALKSTDMRQSLLSPDNLSTLDVLKDHVDLLEFGIVNDFEEGDHIGMSNLLQDGNFPLGLLLGIHIGSNLAEPSLLGESWDDLDSHIFSILEVSGQFDLAMDTAADLVNDLVVVDDLSARRKVPIDIGDMSPTEVCVLV